MPEGATAVFAATLHVAAVWCLTLFVLGGIGRAAQRALGLRGLSGDRLLSATCLGYALTIAALQLWHLVLPVSPRAMASLALGGLLGWVPEARELAALGRAALRRPGRCLFALGLLLWLANIATGPCQFGDTGMYHLPLARWFAAHPIVPGLANLHGRLGINNSSLLLAALFESGPFAGRSHHFTQAPLLLPFLAAALAGAARWLRAGEGRRSSDLFLLWMLPALVYALLSRHFTSLSTDVPAGMLVLLAIWRLVRLVEASPGPIDRPDLVERRGETLLVVALLSTAVVTKVPALPIAALGSLLALWLLWRAERSRGDGDRGAGLRHLLPAIGLALCIGLPWVARNLLLSGLVVYPVSALSIPVEWRVPLDQADGIRSWALDSARMNGRQGPGGPWIGGWLRHVAGGVLVLLPTLTLLLWGALALFLELGRSRARQAVGGAHLSLLGLTVLGAVAWFLGGPNPRFGFGVVWALAACAASVVVTRHRARFDSRSLRRAVACLALLACGHTVVHLTQDDKLDWRRHWLVRAPGEDAGLHPYREVEMREFVTDSGLVLLYPAASSNNAWASPLPGTPYPASNLRERRPGDPSGGYVTDGPWRPQRWPKPSSRYLERWRQQRAGTDHGPPAPR